jgi:RNA polymerase sigma-70 factor (ECF subfamily)
MREAMCITSDELDERLLMGVARGDERAFEALFRRYYPRLRAFFRGRTHDRETADELLQETMIVVWQRARSFNGSCRPSTWILGIAYHKLLDWRRKAQRERKLFQGSSPSDEDASDNSYDVQAQVERELLMERVREALRKLPEEHRVVMELTFQQGLSYGEIAQLLKIPTGTVKSRMFNARRKLKELLEEQGKGDALWRIVS